MAEAVTKLSIALVGWQVIPAVASNILARIWTSITGQQLTARERHNLMLSGLFSYLLVNFITAITGGSHERIVDLVRHTCRLSVAGTDLAI